MAEKTRKKKADKAKKKADKAKKKADKKLKVRAKLKPVRISLSQQTKILSPRTSESLLIQTSEGDVSPFPSNSQIRLEIKTRGFASSHSVG